MAKRTRAKSRRIAKPKSEVQRRKFHWHFAALLAVIVFFSAIRWRLADLPLERDEGEYAYAGQLLLQGIPPYQLAYNMKLPGTYVAYAVILTVFGQTAKGIHLGLLVVNALCVILLYLIVARLFGSLAGLVAGASYVFLTTNLGLQGFAAHATHFVVLAALAGIMLLLHAETTKNALSFFGCGLAFGAAFLMKQPGLLFGMFAFVYLAIRCAPENWKDRGQWPAWAKRMAAFLLPLSLPFALACALLYRAGVFHNFWFWTFSYARQYATTVSLRDGWTLFLASCRHIFGFTTPWPWLLALLGCGALCWDKGFRRQRLFTIGLLLFSCAAVCPGLYFRPHYFVLLAPAVAILIALAVVSASNALASKPLWLRAVPLAVFAVILAVAIRRNADVFFEFSPLEVCRLAYRGNPFAEAVPVADYLRQHTAPTETIMVLGSEPEIYFLAHRHSASGYIYTYGLTENQPYWPAMLKQMSEEVESRRPAYLVVVNMRLSWLMDPQSPQGRALGKWIEQYVAGFDRVGVVEVDEGESHYYWGADALNHRAPGREILILKRKG